MGLPADVAEPTAEELWAGMADDTQVRVLSLFARLIARAVVVEDEAKESR
jgi:hypothetical protein